MSLAHAPVVIVTGSGKGIGQGIAKRFAMSGAQVIIATRTPKDGLETEKALQDLGANATFVQTDVSSEASITSMISTIDQQCGRIDVLVNNAGVTLFKPLFEATIEDWEKVINIDLRGVFLCSKHVAAYMVEKKTKGSIINISSNHANRTLPDTEIYAAAKGGVNAMTRSMAISLGKFGIRVNSISPGFTDTPHYQKWLADKTDPKRIEEEIFALHATGSICTPEDIANLAYFLAFEQSSKITGSDILIDGGLSARLYTSEEY
jgi:NAD(P)-dependent dehydrogenase (short-subunit alcohol dehydrogenase family)